MMSIKKILSVFLVIIILITSVSIISAADDQFKGINTSETRIIFQGSDIDYDGKIIGNITNVSSISDVENMIKDKEAIKEVYSDGLEYLANEGQYYVFEADGDYYVMFIKESSLDIASDCREVCSMNSKVDFANEVPGATDANGFDLEIK